MSARVMPNSVDCVVPSDITGSSNFFDVAESIVAYLQSNSIYIKSSSIHILYCLCHKIDETKSCSHDSIIIFVRILNICCRLTILLCGIKVQVNFISFMIIKFRYFYDGHLFAIRFMIYYRTRGLIDRQNRRRKS